MCSSIKVAIKNKIVYFVQTNEIWKIIFICWPASNLFASFWSFSLYLSSQVPYFILFYFPERLFISHKNAGKERKTFHLILFFAQVKEKENKKYQQFIIHFAHSIIIHSINFFHYLFLSWVGIFWSLFSSLFFDKRKFYCLL